LNTVYINRYDWGHICLPIEYFSLKIFAMRFFMPLGHDHAYSRGKIENRTNFSNQAEPKPTSDFTVTFKPYRALKLWDKKLEP
jgi:hypothetical protein